MGKKSRKKKNADFKKVKLRVGRKLPKQKDVDLSFSTKKIFIRENSSLENKPDVQHILHLSKIVPRLHSRHNEELTSALGELRQWIKQQPNDAQQFLLMEMQSCIVPLVRHIDSKVRTAAGHVFTSLVHLVRSIPAYYPSLAQCMFSTLVHIDAEVRAAGWSYLRTLIDAAPRLLPSLNCELLLEELSRRIPQETVTLASTRAGRAIHLVERLLETISPNPTMEVDRQQTTSKVNDICETFECIFDWEPKAMDTLWLNGHLARASEQGLGWQGQPKYTIANFLSDMAPWVMSLMKGFQNIEDPVSSSARSESGIDLGETLLSLVAILRITLSHHVHHEPISTTAIKIAGDCAVMVWQLFPVAEDATIFQRRGKLNAQIKAIGNQTPSSRILQCNMAIIQVRCLHLAASNVNTNENDTKKLGEFFNTTMAAIWPLQRSLCLQWINISDCCLNSGVMERNPDWLSLLISIVTRIGDCNTDHESKVGLLCRRILSTYQERNVNFMPVKSDNN